MLLVGWRTGPRPGQILWASGWSGSTNQLPAFTLKPHLHCVQVSDNLTRSIKILKLRPQGFRNIHSDQSPNQLPITS